MAVDLSTTTQFHYEISFPASSGAEQDEEWCRVGFPDGSQRRIRFHDYAEIFDAPGLYEQLFAQRLACSSPEVVVGLLGRELAAAGVAPGELSALDLGAGNGMVGEQLARLGLGSIVGADIIEEAASAAARDRPEVYEDYLVADITVLPRQTTRELAGRRLGVLTCVAALGFGDIPPLAFAAAYDLLQDGAWIAFNIRADFLEDTGHDFATLIRGLVRDGLLETLASERYVHRTATDGRPLHYTALIARKRGQRAARERVDAPGTGESP